MNWLRPREENVHALREADARPREDATPARADPYQDVPLGVECAWPVFAQDETHRTAS